MPPANAGRLSAGRSNGAQPLAQKPGASSASGSVQRNGRTSIGSTAKKPIESTARKAATPKKAEAEQQSANTAASPNDLQSELRIGVDWDDSIAKSRAESGQDDRVIVWLDIDNTLYKKSTRIAELMGERIRAYFLSMGLSRDESEELHARYYKEYGLAIRGLVKHHKIDPLDYDQKCDASLPLEGILKPDRDIQRLLSDLDRTKCRVFALTNAYKFHARRVLKLLELEQFCEGIIYCDYAKENFACKPEPEYYLSAMQAIGVKDPAKCYFVDDSALNIKAAKALGWGSCVLFSEVAAPPSTEAEKAAVSSFSASVLLPRANTSSAAGKTNGSAHPNGAKEGLRIPQAGEDFDEEAIQREFRKLPHSMRIRLLNVLLDACMPGDLMALSRALERYLRSTRDIISTLPDSINIKIFEKLEVKELLRCRQVSRKWRNIAGEPALWRSHALALTEGDPVPLTPPEDESEWENLVKGLYFRERNWAKGLAQRLDFFEGHNGFVTSIKLKGRDTLVTGSYDETIRVWDLKSGQCNKVLKAKAISCLDFLLEENILCAGLYDTGRVMVWDMKTWELLQTLSGHNKGIRSVALSKDYLVSVGQDKAIVVWDWRTGAKIVRFGQQSNVSLGVSIVDKDKIVAVTVDGMIRTFSIPAAKMIAQFDLHKLGGKDAGLSAKIAELGGPTGMLQWFAASGNTMTIATKDRVVHLQWREHIVPVGRLASSETRKLSSARSPTTTTPMHSRKESATSMAKSPTTSSLTPSTNGTTRARRDSTASTASVMSTRSVRRTTSGGTHSRTPSSPHVPSAGITPLRTSTTPSARRPPSSVGIRSPVLSSGLASPRSAREGPEANSPGFAFPSSKAGEEESTPSKGADPKKVGPTRYAPNLAAPPSIVEIFRTPDMATGCVDPAKRRIVCSTFSSRAGSDRRLYSSTYAVEKGSLPQDAEEKTPEDEDKHQDTLFTPIGGAWMERAEELQSPPTRPLAMVVDHESIVVGCQDGIVYRLGFIGSKYRDTPAVEEAEALEKKEIEGADAVIEDLTELRYVWKDLMLPVDAAPDHPGRIKLDLVKAVGLK